MKRALAGFYVVILLMAMLVYLSSCTGCNSDMTICGPYSSVPWLP
jgi:hypothetical protein